MGLEREIVFSLSRRVALLSAFWMVCASTPVAFGQLSCPDWVCFEDATSTNLIRTSDSDGVGGIDPFPDGSNDEMDAMSGDVDNDGDMDLVVVYKELGTNDGARRNWFFRNENGVLMDRTTEFVTASDIPGDEGFFTPTNDRDVALADVTGDGFLDIITAVTLAGGAGGSTGTKHMSHPRIYVSLGNDGGGNFLGWNYDDEDRVPTMPAEPRFCSVSAGDTDGDGDLDLYFGDYQQGGSRPVDLNDRLWINNGSGYFTDQSTTRMTFEMTESSFGMATNIDDMNNDGRLDILKDDALNAPQGISISWNNINNTAGVDGTYTNYTIPYGHAPYHINTGDLNNDDLLDVVVSDDGQDSFFINQGPGGPNSGPSSFGPRITLGGAPSQFDGNNLIAYVDDDAWADVLITNTDVDLPGGACTQRGRIYHNLGGAVGGTPTITYQGDLGIELDAYRGSHDVIVEDFNGDGANDIFIGSCHGTWLYFNELPFGVTFFYPNGRPLLLTPDEDTEFELAINPFGGTVNNVKLMLSTNGSAFQPFAASSAGGNIYLVTIPGSDCADRLEYYMVVEFDAGPVFNDPPNAPAENFLSIPTNGTAVEFEDDMESGGSSWTVSSDPSLSTGEWEAVDPDGTLNGASVSQPEDAAQGSIAFITQNCTLPDCSNPGAADVDGGATYLTSPELNLAGLDGIVNYTLWAYSTGDDNLQVHVSNNGTDWVLVEEFNTTFQSWSPSSFIVSNFVTPSATTFVRFTAQDTGEANLTEAGVDLFSVERLVCGECDLLNCDDGNPCTDDSCVEGSGCQSVANSAGCDDGNACTLGDFCSGGSCNAGAGTPDCDDGNLCTTNSCNPASGCEAANNSNACDDDSPCTHSDACGGGACNGIAVNCSGSDDQCNVASCDEFGSQGNCEIMSPVANGTTCDDGDPCVVGEACSAGACGRRLAPDCSGSSSECTLASCSPAGEDGNCDTVDNINEGGQCNSGLGLCESGTCLNQDLCNTYADCADTDGDNRRDDNCVWWDCVAGSCAGTDIPFADMGGSNGACPPDLTADGNDRFHALNCFSNSSTQGPEDPYECEDNPPSAYRADAGGEFGGCIPDGVCDGNDAFHAINSFEQNSTCSCSGPAPSQGPFEPRIMGSADLTVRASHDVVAPGKLVEIDVVLSSGAKDLRGYQLHLGVSGGARGSLQLEDIIIEPSHGFVYENLGHWQAFNVHTAQMVVGLEQSGVAIEREGYLATFVYRVSDDAAGTFTIDLLHDDADPAQRTFLFPTPATGKVDIDGTTPAVIEVLQRRSKRLSGR